MDALFPDEWVLIEDVQTNAALEVLGGRVLWHGKDREEGYRVVAELRPRRFTIFFTGSDPDGMEYML
jgi:hypothetical protein